MRKLRLRGAVAVAALMALIVGSAVPAHAQRADGGSNVGGARAAHREAVVERIVAKWANHVAEVYRLQPDEWAAQMASVFASATDDALQRAANARRFDDMNDQLLRGDVGRSEVAAAVNTLVTSNGTGQRLGDAAADLVFVPVTPCRIIDTRVAGGVISANSVRSFDVTAVSNFAFQGGDATDCGIGAAGSFAAAVINFTVVTPSTGGYITVFPFLGTQPLASTLNYAANDVRGSLATVKLDQGASANEMSVYTLAQTHLVADVVGFFTAPEATPLECVEVLSAGTTIAAGSFGTQSTASCAAGYTITGGGCSMSNFDGRVVTSRSIVSGASQTHFCAFRNEGAGAVDGVAYGRCCQVPGR